MKALLCLLLATLTASAAWTISLMWDPNTDTVTGYKLYIGSESGSYYASNVLVGVTNVSGTFTNLTNNIYYFAVTAYLDLGFTNLESGFSGEVKAILGPHIPKNFRSTNNTQMAFVLTNSGSTIVEWSKDLITWRTDAPPNLAGLTVTLDLSNPKQQFWRVR